MKRPVRIANFSGTLGDYHGAFHDCVHGDPVDVIIGDFLAEMTMGKVTETFSARNQPTAQQDFYLGVFLKQLAPELEDIAQRGLKVVTNAGAFNPAGMAHTIRQMIDERGLNLSVAHVEGDNLLPRFPDLSALGQFRNLDTGAPIGERASEVVAANAYLGGWGIVKALESGADIVITGRVADASLVTGPAAWWHGWRQNDFDRLASACAAGHVIECGPQAMGGNFSGFTDHEPAARLGFPIAEISGDGSTVFTKRPGDAGQVTIDTVTAQLNYEIQGPCYLNPDVIVHFDTVNLHRDGPDRIRMHGVKGSPPPETTKVACFYPNGHRALLFLYVTGLDWREKCRWLKDQMQTVADSLDIDSYHFDILGRPLEDPTTQAEATVAIRVAAAARDPKVLKRFEDGYSSFGLGGIPGFYGDTMNGYPVRVEFWPGLVRQDMIDQVVICGNGDRIAVSPPPMAPFAGQALAGTTMARLPDPPADKELVKIPLGHLVHTRSGDKGANANLGVWCREPENLGWLDSFLTEDRLRTLMSLPDHVTIERYQLHNLNGLYFVLRGYFGESGAGNIGLDQIGKAAGEFLRSRLVDVPASLLPGNARPVDSTTVYA